MNIHEGKGQCNQVSSMVRLVMKSHVVDHDQMASLEAS